MELKRLTIKNYGDIDELDFKPKALMSCVTSTVSNAICHVLNNQFAIRHYNTVELARDSYLFGEIYHYKNGKATIYTTEIKGLSPPIFTKNGEKMTDEQVENDPVLSRPYREDNASIFCAMTKNTFLDYGGFLPTHFSRLNEYSQSFKACIEGKTHLCNMEKDYIVLFSKGKGGVYQRWKKSSIRAITELSQCDKLCGDYTTFLLLLQMIDFHGQDKGGEGAVRTPVVVDGLYSELGDEGTNARFLLYKTMTVGRQAFFVEKYPHKVQVVIDVKIKTNI